MTSKFKNFRSYAKFDKTKLMLLFGCGFISQSAQASHSILAKHLIVSQGGQLNQDRQAPVAQSVSFDQRFAGYASEDLLSIQNSDKSKAKRLLPFDADVQLVKRQAHSTGLQVIGTNKQEVWAFDVAFQVAKVKRIGKLFLPDSATLARIEKAVSGSKIILAYQILPDNLPAENPWTDLVSTSQMYTAFVQAQNSLYKVSFNAGDSVVVQRLGALKN